MNLLVRADASVTMGTGHVMRCLALAQAWQDAGGAAIFAASQITPAMRSRLAAESCEVVAVSGAAGTAEDAGQTAALAREWNAAWIVVDGYQFTGEYQRAIKDAGSKLLILDDYGQSEHYCADLVLNQNVDAHARLYTEREPYTRLLLGTKYSLLRREFGRWRDWKREIVPLARKVLVTMGGSDPENVTARAIAALERAHIEGAEAKIVVGGSNPHFSELQKMFCDSPFPIEFYRDALNIGEFMAWADMAVSAAGSTCWELSFLGLPPVLLDLAQNQTSMAEQLHKRHCAIHAGNGTAAIERLAEAVRSLAESRQLRETLSQNLRRLVDGEGSRRVVSALSGKEQLRLRRATREDCELLWHWANDSQVRAASFSPDPIPWQTHQAWFEKKNTESGAEIFIAENENGESVGQIRFERRADGGWEVDVSIAQAKRGRGLAAELVALGVDFLQQKNRGGKIHAFVKPSNVASIKAFERAGFIRNSTEKVQGYEAVHLVRA